MNIGQLTKDFVISFERIRLFDKSSLSSELIKYCAERGCAISSTMAEMELDKLLGTNQIKKASELSTIELVQFQLSHVEHETLNNLYILGGNYVAGISRRDSS